MITEDYVSFETAKLLKERGFGGECLSMYISPKYNSGKGNPNDKRLAPHGRDNSYYEGYQYECEAPTLQMTMKWLREVHHITIGITFSLDIITYEIQKDEKVITAISSSRSYEDMVEEAIKLCLENLI